MSPLIAVAGHSLWFESSPAAQELEELGAGWAKAMWVCHKEVSDSLSPVRVVGRF